jgi:hypothetical protein
MLFINFIFLVVNTLRLKYWIEKLIALSCMVFLAVFLVGCSKYHQDPSLQFPECIGTKDSLNPYHPSASYSVAMHGKDTINIKMIFTNYTNTIFPTFRWPMWHLWVASTFGTETRYYEGTCNPVSGETDRWYGTSGLLYKGEYASCDFLFDKLTCTETEGSCTVVPIFTFDSLDYHFSGKK